MAWRFTLLSCVMIAFARLAASAAWVEMVEA
jgi:hypothetical protein